MPQVIKVTDAPQALQVDDNVQLIYPSSKDGTPQGREGRIEKLLPAAVLVEVPHGRGFRTFAYSRIVGGTITRLG
jgi:hypothetical protein